MKKIFRLATFGVITGIVTVATAVLPASAEAEIAPLNQCGADLFCLFVDHDFGGTKLEVAGNIDNLATVNFNDKASSMINNTTHSVKLYLDSKQQAPNETPVYIAKAHSQDTTFSNNGCNDAVSRIVIES